MTIAMTAEAEKGAVSLPRDMFARLGKDVSLHLTPGYGTLFCGDPPELNTVSGDLAGLLADCDGTRRVDEMLDAYLASNARGDDGAVAVALAKFVDYIRDDTIVLTPERNAGKIDVTGSVKAYIPTHMQVELTTQCNLGCEFCYRRATSDGKDDRLDTDALLDILENLRRWGLRSVELTGGEPLMHKDFDRILDFCGARFFLVGLLTNGTLITEDVLASWAPYREKMVVSVSLDGSTAAAHNLRRGRPFAFDKTTAAIRMLAARGFTTRATMTVDEENWADLEPTLKLAKALGATLFSYSPVLPFGRAEDNFAFWKTDGNEVVAVHQKLEAEYSGFLQTLSDDVLQDLENSSNCGAGHRNCAMDPHGRVRPCVTFDDDMAVMGSLAEDSPETVFGSKIAKACATVDPPTETSCGDCRWTLFCRYCILRGMIAAEWDNDQDCRWMAGLERQGIRLPELLRH